MAGSLRDDFNKAIKRTLAARVANRCANPDCRSSTSGPQADPRKAVNLGVAAHITAASPGGPRYDSCITPDQCMAPDNGIWLCQNCAKLVDNDPIRYTADVLRGWKASAESEALTLVGKAVSTNPLSDQVVDKWVSLDYIEKAGIAQTLRDEGYKLSWVSANNESKRIDLEGWEYVILDRDGKRVCLKIHDSPAIGGYLVLIRKKEASQG